MSNAVNDSTDRRGQLIDILLLAGFLAAFLFAGFWASVRWRPRSGDWATDFSRQLIDPAEFTNGGMGRDGLRSIDEPQFTSVIEALAAVDPQAPVIAVAPPQEQRAYPLHILLHHEIVNDVLADVPIAITFCPLCHSGIVYERVVEGQVLRLGVSGNLYNSGFIMYDDRTESWWQQFTGRAVVGTYTGEVLPIRPSQIVSLAAFAEQYPDGRVLTGDARYPEKDYSLNPYLGYDSAAGPMFKTASLDDRLAPMERVLAAEINGMPIAYSFQYLREMPIANETIAGEPIVSYWQPGAVSVLDGPTLAQSHDVGMAAMFSRRVGDDVLTFSLVNGVLTDEQTGSTWNIFGRATSGPLQGVKLTVYHSFQHFWFAWAATHPDTRLIAP